MAIVTGIVGVCVASMIVAVIVQKISLSQAEERVHNFMARTKHARSVCLKHEENMRIVAVESDSRPSAEGKLASLQKSAL